MTETQLEANRRTEETEMLANLVFEESLVGKMKLAAHIREENESRRSGRGLRHVIDADFPRDRCGAALEIHGLEETIQFARLDAARTSLGYLIDQMEESLHLMAGGR